MLSLIYRELHLTRKTLVTCLFVYFLFALLTDLYALSMRVGNLAKYCSPEELSWQLSLVPSTALFGYLILLVTAPETIFQIMDGDFKTPWLKYALASPKTIREQVGAKYLAYLIMTVCALVLGFLHLMISCALSGQGIPGGMLPLFLATALLVMTISALFLPIAFYVQNIDVINILLVIPIALLTLGLTFSSLSFFMANQDADPLDYVLHVFERFMSLQSAPLMNILKILAPFVALLVIVGSFFLSVFVLDKRRLVKGGYLKGSKDPKGTKKGGEL
ncbi:MAG: ABC-2 transporter permease [Lachnospiraceae bacterium]|nr:ABC-2 transporter permease [Lachnospiraceae bacterium]